MFLVWIDFFHCQAAKGCGKKKKEDAIKWVKSFSFKLSSGGLTVREKYILYLDLQMDDHFFFFKRNTVGICFPESAADGHQHATGRASLRHVRVQDAAAAAADADGSSRPVQAGQHVGPGTTGRSHKGRI